MERGRDHEVRDPYIVNVEGLLTPSSVWLADARTGAVSKLKSRQAQFDASRDTVEQLEAS
jgi:prolyl oligopeptidase